MKDLNNIPIITSATGISSDHQSHMYTFIKLNYFFWTKYIFLSLKILKFDFNLSKKNYLFFSLSNFKILIIRSSEFEMKHFDLNISFIKDKKYR